MGMGIVEAAAARRLFHASALCLSRRGRTGNRQDAPFLYPAA
jgi:hypothetical protein